MYLCAMYNFQGKKNMYVSTQNKLNFLCNGSTVR